MFLDIIIIKSEQWKNIKNNILLFIFVKNEFDKFLLVKIDKLDNQTNHINEMRNILLLSRFFNSSLIDSKSLKSSLKSLTILFIIFCKFSFSWKVFIFYFVLW